MKTTKKVVLDMIPVVIGVLIALFIDSCKDQISEQRFVNRVLESMELEMRENKEEFSETLELQYALSDTLEAYMSSDDISLADVLIISEGVQIPTVKNTSWRSFLNSKMEIIDYEIITQMTEIEEEKQYLRMKSEKLLDYVYENARSTDPGIKEIFWQLMWDIIDTEQSLLEHFNTFLEARSEADA